MSAFISNDDNLDDLLEPRSSSKISNVGLISNGTDISNLFERASSGTPATGLAFPQINGLFAQRGSVSQWSVSFSGSPYETESTGSSLTGAFARLTVRTDGTIWLDDNINGSRQAGRIIFSGGASTGNTRVRFIITDSANVSLNQLSNWLAVGSSTREILIEAVDPTPQGEGHVSGRLEISELPNGSDTRTASVTLNASVLFGV